jgi:hypothetical protein
MKAFHHRRQTSLILFALFVFFISACGSVTPPAQSLTILPHDCEVPISEQIPLTLSGSIDPNSQVAWQASLGSIVNNSQGFSAFYVAPSIAGEAIIYATITSALNSSPIQLSLTCRIIDAANTALLGTAGASASSPLPIVISEVMGNTCGGIEERKYNQYIELYNYSNQPVDVGGLWIYDEGESGTPDQIVAWKQRALAEFDSNLIFDSTVIPANGVGVVLSPVYQRNSDVAKMTYNFPDGTVILTVFSSETIGDDFFGIIADQNGYDTVTLYIGGATVIEKVIDTYGTPYISSAYPVDIRDDYNDNIPNYLNECSSIERINPRLPDSESNWQVVLNGTPGEYPDQ